MKEDQREERSYTLENHAKKEELKAPPMTDQQFNNILTRHNLIMITQEKVDLANKWLEENIERDEQGKVTRYPTRMDVKIPKLLGYKMSAYKPLVKLLEIHEKKVSKETQSYAYLYCFKQQNKPGTLIPIDREKYNRIKNTPLAESKISVQEDTDIETSNDKDINSKGTNPDTEHIKK